MEKTINHCLLPLSGISDNTSHVIAHTNRNNKVPEPTHVSRYAGTLENTLPSTEHIVETKAAAPELSNRQTQLTLSMAEDALRRTLPVSLRDALQMTLTDIELGDTTLLAWASTELALNTLGTLLEGKARTLTIVGTAQQKISEQRAIEYQQKIETAIMQNDKACKAGVTTMIFDWIVASVEILSGIGNALTGNLLGAGLDFAAGITGLARVVAEMLLVFNPKKYAHYQTMVDEAGKLQLAFEMAGAVVDVLSVVRGVINTRLISRSTEQILAKKSENLLKTAFVSESSEALQEFAHLVGKEVSEQAADQVFENLSRLAKPLTREISCPTLHGYFRRLGFRHLAEHFTAEAIQEIVTQSVVAVSKKLLCHETIPSAEKLAKMIAKEVNHTVLKRVIYANQSLIYFMKQALPGVLQINSGIQDLQQAESEYAVQHLLSDQQWLDWCFEYYEKQKTQTYGAWRDVFTQQVRVLDVGRQTLTEHKEKMCQLFA